MFYTILADVILVIHIAYAGYAVIGQLLILIGWLLGWTWIRNPWFRVSHLITVLIVSFEAAVDIRCPLTIWEEELRAQTEGGGSYIGQWIQSSLTFDPAVFNVMVAVAATIVVGTLIFAPPRFRKAA